jgi:molecular chaperone DnaK (HSP70)
MPRYLVGIDLGTTNIAVSYVDLQAKVKGGVKLHSFPILQLVGPGQPGTRPLMPSFLYLPGPHDLPDGSTALPWDQATVSVIGRFAREHGAKIPGRLVSSAKSWLCHPGVDRTAPLLPWAAPPDVARLSPLAVSARYLRHLVDAWNHTPGRSPDDFLEKCPVVLTVPASFDDVARNLTAEAAKQAGLLNVTLLEEPQAAFYCWLGMHPAAEGGQLKPGMRCVVIDVGGGTSDFSLIRAGEENGDMTFARDAVGEHLLLGGDNMDLALAKAVEGKLSGKLDAAQFGALVQACRGAKEALLAPKPPADYAVTVVGKGRSVIGKSVTAHMTTADLTDTLFNGFFPTVPFDVEPNRTNRTGLQELGLPYVNDPAITKHLASFLRQQLPNGAAPDAILFNGGMFQPQPLRDRILEVMTPWFEQNGKPWKPVVLTNPSLDLAVSWGAAYSAWLQYSGGRRIGGGIARSYYLGVSTVDAGERKSAAPKTDPAMRTDFQTVVCVVPRRLQEGEEVRIPKPEFELAIGEPVLFPLYTSTVRSDDKPGDLLQVSPDQLLQLPPLHTILRGGKRAGAKRVPVTLAAKSTEIGTLELSCVSRENNRWKLEFNVRDVVTTSREPEEAEANRQVLDVFDEGKTQAAAEAIRGTFTRGLPTPQELTKQLESSLELNRSEWPTGLCRRLWDSLTEVADNRVKSPLHLSRWYNLAGFSLRPGFGDPIDRYRVEALWKLITATASGAISGGNKLVVPEGGADYWIMWRRVSGGLNGALQQALWARLKLALIPAKNKPAPKVHPNELAEMWRAAASMERLDAKTKELLGDTLVGVVKRQPLPHYLFWSLTRLGTRVQFYGPLNTVVHPDVAERWIEQILDFHPESDNERLGWAFCLAQLARRSGLRGVDLSDEVCDGVAKLLRSMKLPEAWPKMVEEVVASEGDEQSRLFGESLPIGLRLSSG